MTLVGIFLIVAVILYNRLITRRNGLREAWSGIEVQLKRRHDLIPALIEIVKSYSKHEQELLENVTRQRSEARKYIQQARPSRLQETQSAENSLTKGISQLIAISEAYPEIRAYDQYKKLAEKLVEVEDQLQYARRYYNGSARDLNNAIETFPSNIISKLFRFRKADYFEVSTASERNAPNLDQSK